MAAIIDGKLLASKKEEELKVKFSKLRKKPLVFSILIGDDPASHLYTSMKQKKAAEVGIDFQPLKFSEDTQFEYIADRIKSLNTNQDVVGIMIQLPLPQKFLGSHSKEDLINSIETWKDIDGLKEGSLFMSATVKGVISILDTLNLDSFSTTFAVVGSEGEVGRPLIKALKEKGVKNIVKIDKKIPESKLEDAVAADVVISATGVNNLIKSEFVKDGATLIDVGLGDFEEAALRKSSQYTPKIGGVGPMTIVSLMENIYESAKKTS